MNVEVPLPASTLLTFHWYIGEPPPFVGVAVNTTVSPEQMLVTFAATDTDGVSIGSTLTTIAVDVMMLDVAHATFDVSLHVIESLSTRPVVEYVDSVWPTMFRPFLIHWYCGLDPPSVMDVEKFACSPAQMLVGPAMVIVGVTSGLTVSVMVDEVAGLLPVHESVDVITQFTWSPFAGDDSKYVAELVPTLNPFLNHA